jgi:hypothetical protein
MMDRGFSRIEIEKMDGVKRGNYDEVSREIKNRKET